MNHIQERVEHLERQLTIQRKISIAVGMILLGAIGFGFSNPRIDEMVLRKLTIVDENYNPRVVLSSVIDEGVSMGCVVHFDAKGNRRLWQGTEGDIISTTYYDNKGTMRQAQGVHGEEKTTWLSYFDDDGVIQGEFSWKFGIEDDHPLLVMSHGAIYGVEKIMMFDEDEHIRVVMDADDEEHAAGLHFFDDEKMIRMSLGTGPDELTGFVMYDEKEQARWVTYIDEDVCEMHFKDKNGSERINNVVFDNGDTFFSINDPNETFDILMGSMSSGNSIFCLDGEKDGTLHREIPSK